jgi:hypothetical protein
VKRCSRRGLLVASAIAWAAGWVSEFRGPAWAAEDKNDPEAVLARVTHDIRYLASDELEGRGPGTDGLDVAGEFIIEEFKKAGLNGALEGDFKQPFTIEMGTDLIKPSAQLALDGGANAPIELVLGKDYQPQVVGGDADLAGRELVFIGYGIRAAEHNYDDYAGLDVAGKVLVMIRREPQQNREDSVFDGTAPSAHALINTKLAVATEAQAAAIVFVNDFPTAPSDEQDELMPPDGFGRAGAGIPFFHVKRAAIDRLLSESPLVAPDGSALENLQAVEQLIDETLEPISQPISGWQIDLRAQFGPVTAPVFNVVGIVEGEGPLADETIVIGAHYDHLGFGGSRAPGRREVHNGADDNATGTAGVLELARRFGQAEKKPSRRLVFIAFSGEERGLLGSSHYCENPLFPLESTVAMINFDMIGWLRDGKLTVYGTASAPEFDAILDRCTGEDNVELNKIPNAFAGSDHMPFFQKNIPVMFLHTGLTDTYHTPEDDFESINVPGAVQVINFSEKLIREVASMPARPTFAAAGESTSRRRTAYLGVELDFQSGEGLRPVISVAAGSPAEKAGIKAGDLIVSVAGKPVTERNELLDVLRENEPGTRIQVELKRGEETLTVEVELGRSPRRRGGAPS